MSRVWTAQGQNRPKPAPKPQTNPKPAGPTDQVNISAYSTNPTTLKDLQNRYGMDYSQGYAAQQAQTEGDAKRAGYANQLRQVDDNLRGANDALQRNQYQQYLQQAQSQVGSGINGGIAAEQNLRLSMNGQAQLGNLYRDAATQRVGLQAGLANVGNEQATRQNQIYNERLQQAFENAQVDTSSRRSENQAMLNAYLQQRSQNIENERWDKNFAYQQQRDKRRDAEWESQQKADRAWREQTYNRDQEWREYTYNNMSAAERAQLDQRRAEFGEDAAWRLYQLEYQGNMAQSQSQAELDFYKSLGMGDFLP
ncbi:hypothetical protein [Cytobacillus oceanisediminis]|uniref:hypothetical protein n=1 Tax=Cytobacillus oceanisediminis TaxID=665099 RepID=UPI001C234BE2|nr:hypothetical protein [Cytobacillus oceanisediminis]MBU8770339.1 hypothetical protein [Cytobacillus oceanisediminis]